MAVTPHGRHGPLDSYWGLCGRHSHGVSPRDSHEISPIIGGVHKLMILLRDLVEEIVQKIFGEEMEGGQGDPDPIIL